MGLLRLCLETFIERTSMRGFRGFYHAPRTGLRLLWLFYLISMATLLLSSVYYLVFEYLDHHVTVQESDRVQHVTPLPAICVCSQGPIGFAAAGLWRSGRVKSPGQLNQELRASMLAAYRAGNLPAAKELFFADKLSTYFQNLAVDESRSVGMRPEEMLLLCLMRHSKNNNPSVSHDETCQMSVRLVRHPLYLNCYDITIDEADSPQVSTVSLVLQSGDLLTPHSDRDADSDSGGTEDAAKKDAKHTQAHVNDVFTQALGMRVTLHEPGTHPDIDRHGVSVGLQQNSELRYRLVQRRRLSISGRSSDEVVEPSGGCSPDTPDRRLRDIDQVYRYTFTGCMSEAIGRLILSECGCVSAFHLVASPPNASHPFCHAHNRLMGQRLNCVRDIRLPSRIAHLRSQHCPQRCNFNRYQLQASSARWLPSSEQLRLALNVTQSWEVLERQNASHSHREAADRTLESYLSRNQGSGKTRAGTGSQQNRSSNAGHERSRSQEPELEKLTLVTVSRSSYDTLLRTEVLQITLPALLARIGGLGSLTIGCTLAVAFELIELVCLTAIRSRETSGRKQPNLRLDSRPLPGDKLAVAPGEALV